MDKAASTGHSDRCRIVVDTCCDFSPEVAANLDVDILGFPFIIDGEERTDDIWSSMSPKEFYDRMRAGARVSTSAVSLGRYIEFFTECAKEGTPTVYLCFTSALSSSYNSACQAADAVRAEYPNFELYVVDNALPCATGELLALEAVRQRSAGLTAKQLVDWANEAKTYVHGYFTLESFDALAAGGRIPPAAAQLTAKLDVKPELSYDLAGSLSLIGVNRGRKKALKSILKSFRENYVPDRTMPIAIMTADAEKDGDWLEAAVRKEEGCADVTIIRSSVGPTIGSHVGPGMVACAFWGKNRADKASLVFSLPHTQGSLSKVLTILSFYDINLTKIQSLPNIGHEWEYLFYVDLTFDNLTRYRQSIDAITPLVKKIKVLGEYEEKE